MNSEHRPHLVGDSVEPGLAMFKRITWHRSSPLSRPAHGPQGTPRGYLFPDEALGQMPFGVRGIEHEADVLGVITYTNDPLTQRPAIHSVVVGIVEVSVKRFGHLEKNVANHLDSVLKILSI